MVVGIDEIATYVPAARAMSKVTLELGTWLQQIRKRRIEIFMATQFPQDITRTVLRQVDYFMEPDPILEGRHVQLYFYDIWGQYSGDYSYKKWPPTREDSFNEKVLPFTNRVFNMYDTNEIFQPIWMDTAERDKKIDARGWTFDSGIDEATAQVGQRLTLPAPMESEDDLGDYLKQLAARFNGKLRIGHVFSDVTERYQGEIDWSHPKDMEAFLGDQGWTLETIGSGQHCRYATPPED